MKNLNIVLLISFFVLGAAKAQNTTWNFDKSHTSIGFTAIHMSISEVGGEFHDFSGTVKTDGDDFANAVIEFTVQAKSIDTDNEKRDGHLSSEDFLYVEKHPEIKFKSTSFKKVGDNKFQLIGDLTIRGKTQSEQFDVKHFGTVEAMDKTIAGFKITGTINRFDYGVDWNKTFTKGLVVSEEINIVCDVELIKGE